MNRADYLKELDSRLLALNNADRRDALSYYEEIFDERGIGMYDEVPFDMQNPKQASYEILRDINIDHLNNEHRAGKKKKYFSLFTVIILSILAMPTASIVSIVLISLFGAALISLAAIFFSIIIGAIAAIFASINEWIFYFPHSLNMARGMYLIGVILLSIASILLVFILFKSIFVLVKNWIIKRKNKKEATK